MARLGEAAQQRFSEAAGEQRVLHGTVPKRRLQSLLHTDGARAVKARDLTSSKPTTMCSGSPHSDG